MKQWMKKTLSAVISLSMILSSAVAMPITAGAENASWAAEMVQPALKHVYITASYRENQDAVSGYDTVLTANYISGNGELSDMQYQWYRLDSGVSDIAEAQYIKEIPDATGSEYITVAEDIGRMLICVVTPNGDQNQAVCSDIFGEIVEVTGTGAPVVDRRSLEVYAEGARVGDTLHAYYAYQSPAGVNEGETKIIWKRSDVPAINDGTKQYYTGCYKEEIGEGPVYTLQPEDYGKYISFEVTPADANGQIGEAALPQMTLSNGNSQNYSAFYITPENLLANAKFYGATRNVSNSLDEEYRGVRDFRLQNSVMKYYNSGDGEYIVDAGHEITFNSLFICLSNLPTVEIETSLNGVDYEPYASQDYGSPGLVTKDTPVTARYIKLKFPNMTKYGSVFELQAYLQPQSFSEIFAADGAEVNRDEKTITQIPAGTTVSQLKSMVKGSTIVPEMKVLNYTGELVGDNEEIISGYTLKVTSNDGTTSTEYTLIDTNGMPGTIVSSITVTPEDEDLGYRSGCKARVAYILEDPITGEEDTQTPVAIQWYYAPEENGDYTSIPGAQAEEFLLTDKQVGGFLKVEITPEDGIAKMSEPIGPVKKAISTTPEAPICENVTITAPAETICDGDTLTGSYRYFDANGSEEDKSKTQKQWFRVENGGYTPIAGAVSEQYTLTAEDVGYDIAYGVKPWSFSNPSVPDDILEGTFYYSEPVCVVKNPVLSDRDALTLGISGKVKSNLVLPAKGENGSVITWKSGNPAVISDSGVVNRGETDVTVTLTAALKHPDRAFTATKEFTVVVAKQDANPRPPVEHVYIKQLSDGKLEVQYTLNGVSESDLKYQWYWVDGTAVERDTKVKAISGATQKTYQPTSDNTGKMLLCNVIPNGDQTKAAASDTFGRIIALTGSGKPVVDGEAAGIWAQSTQVGDTLYAVYSYQSPSGTPEEGSEIKWLRSESYTTGMGAFQEIPGAAGAAYTLTPEDYGKFITYSVTPRDQNGRTGDTVSPWNNSKSNVIYCTPENLLADAKAVYDGSGSGIYTHTLMGAHRGVRDFRTDQNVSMYYAGAEEGSPGWYIVDAGKEITFDRLLYIADTSSIRNVKAEVSMDGIDYTEVYSAHPMKDSVDEMLLEEPVTARYIKFTFTRFNGKWHAVREVQAFLQPESFSELFAVNLEGAVYDRAEKAVTRIPEGTTVAQIKESVTGSNQAPVVKVLDYTGAEAADNEEIISGYTLISTSQNGKTETEYTLSNTDTLPNVVVKTLAAVPADTRLGVRVGETVTAAYELSAFNGTPDDTKTAFQWYYSPEENGVYTEIAGAAAKSYTVAEEYLDGYLKVKVEPADGVARTSAAVGPVKPEVSDIPTAPKAENVEIQTEGQTLYAGDTLKGSYEYFDANADEEDKAKTKLQWYREKDGKRAAITGAVTDTYQLTVDDEDCNILYGVQPYTSMAEPYAGEIAYSAPVYVTMEPARADFNALEISGISGKVTKNLVLPIRGKNGSAITWESSNPNVISTAGIVKRTGSDEEVTLTATIKHPDRELTMEKVFEDIVVAKTSGGGGSSSGGGSGGNTGIYIPPVTATPSPKPEDPQTPEDNGNEFGITDMAESDWAYPYVMDLMEKGVLSKPEDGKFNPKNFLKREEAVKMLVEMFDMLDETAECDFTDVGENDWSYPYIASAYTKQMINGMGDGTFGRGADVTRQDFAVMAYHFLKANGIEKPSVNDAVVFTDASDISDYAEEAVAYLTEAGIINGTPEGAFLPANQITREEAAKIVSGLL